MLGDVLPVPLSHEVLSFGDLIVVLGAADAVRELSRRRRARRPLAGSAPGPHGQGEGRPGLGHGAERCSCVGHPVLGEPGASTPARIDLPSAEPATSEPELVAASHSR